MIRLLKRLLFFLWILILFAFGAYLTSENAERINVTLMGFTLPQASVGTYLIAALFIGLLIGFFSTFLLTQIKVFKQNRKLSKVEKEVKRLQLSNDA